MSPQVDLYKEHKVALFFSVISTLFFPGIVLETVELQSLSSISQSEGDSSLAAAVVQ